MILLIILAAIALLSWFIFDKRFKMSNNNEIPNGYEKTEESFIDPINKKRYRVYYNAADGSRYYYEEPE
ncbi:MAG: hypothetical protein CVU90_14595 [Firmicutes bacterium HGW-Firmicutes-15]|nr:MAG: hypothetical protein CVU90_14595 [Firmicutes bacterium HGW-Firmicutes-15]